MEEEGPTGIGIGCGCARKGRGTNGKREEYSPQDFNESGRYYCTNRRSGTIKFLALIVCLERESNSFLKCFKFALLPISYPGFFWRKIDSNYHILYCKYNRLPIIIFPLNFIIPRHRFRFNEQRPRPRPTSILNITTLLYYKLYINYN